jgi:hypothetical protein
MFWVSISPLGCPLPAQISLLNYILRIHHAAQHPVSYGEEEEEAVRIKDPGWVRRLLPLPVPVATLSFRFHLCALF